MRSSVQPEPLNLGEVGPLNVIREVDLAAPQVHAEATILSAFGLVIGSTVRYAVKLGMKSADVMSSCATYQGKNVCVVGVAAICPRSHCVSSFHGWPRRSAAQDTERHGYAHVRPGADSP